MKKKTLVKANSLATLKAAEGGKILGGGSLVSASMLSTAMPPKGYIAQLPRTATSNLLATFRKDSPKVYIHLAPALFDHPRKRFALTIDAGLAWGMKQKGVVALISGIADDEGDGPFTVTVLVFEEGSLVSLVDYELQDRSTQRFKIGAEAMVAEIKNNFSRKVDLAGKGEPRPVRVVLAAPLSDWQIEGVEYLGEKVLSKARYRPLVKAEKASGNLLLPSAIVGASMLVYFGLIGIKYNALEQAKAAYEVAYDSKEVKDAGGVDAEYIGVMTQRKTFMETPRRQDVLPAKVLEIVQGIGVLPGVKIIELQLPAPGLSTTANDTSSGAMVSANGGANQDLITSTRVADAQIKISVPRSGQPALLQARDVLDALAKSTGMSMRLALQSGYQDDGDKKRRTFTIEGFIHG